MSIAIPAALREARREALVSRQVIEGLLLGLVELPRGVDRAPLSGALGGMLGSLAAWSETDVDHPEIHERLSAVLATVTSAIALFRSIESPSAARAVRSLGGVEAALARCKELTVDAIVASQERLLRAPAEVEAPPERPFRASVGTPALQRIARPVIAPVVAVAPRVDDDGDDEGDEDDEAIAAPPSGPVALAPAGDPGEIAQLRALARDCLADLGIFENLRHRNEDEPWTAVGAFEQRLLDNADALLSLEIVEPGASRSPGVIALALREAADSSFPDPGRAFAASFALGCLEGEDVIDVMLLGLRQADPETLGAHRSALCLGPSPGIAAGARRLLKQGDPRLLELALDVLRERREASFADAAVLLGHGDPRVASEAARALGVVPERAAAVAALEDALLDEPDEIVAAAIAESLLLLGSPRGLAVARERLREELALPLAAASEALPQWKRVVSLGGEASDVELLLAAFAHSPGDPGPLGWLGHVSAIRPLAAALAEEAGRGGLRSWASEREGALTEALHRITGAEVLTPPSLGAPAAVFDAAAFDAWWKQNEKHFSPRGRYRFGQPYTVAHSVDELAREASSSPARENAALEIAVALGAGTLLSTGDWVARQQAEIEVLRAKITAKDAPLPPAGSFLGSYVGARSRLNPSSGS